MSTRIWHSYLMSEEKPLSFELKKTDETYYPRMCPRWQRCSVGKCPLDPKNALRSIQKEDPEQTCLCHLRTRLDVIAQAQKDGAVRIPGGGYRQDEAKRIEEGVKVTALLAEWDAKEQRKRDHVEKMHAGRKKDE